MLKNSHTDSLAYASLSTNTIFQLGNLPLLARFETFTVTVKTTVFWDVMPYSLVMLPMFWGNVLLLFSG
jgi:hypothetical protein